MTEDTAIALVEFTRSLTKTDLQFKETTPGGSILCTTPKGGTYVIVVNTLRSGEYWVQSLLKVRNPRNRYSWLVGGSPGVNTTLIAGWGPVVVFKLPLELWAAEMDSQYPRENWIKLLSTGVLKFPEHITREAVDGLT